MLPSSLEYIKDWLSTQSIRKLPGIGPVSEQILGTAFEIRTCGDIFQNRYKLALIYADDPNYWQGLLFSALGLYSTRSDDHDEQDGFEDDQEEGNCLGIQKSISVDRSFQPTTDISVLRNTSIEILKEVIFDALSRMPANMLCCTLTLRVKTDTFQVFTRSQTTRDPVPLDDLSSSYSKLEPLSQQVKATQMLILAVGFNFGALSTPTDRLSAFKLCHAAPFGDES